MLNANPNTNPLADTVEWFRRAVPSPTAKNINVQLGVHFEEVAEMVVEFHTTRRTTDILLKNAYNALTELADHLKQAGDDIVVTVQNRVGVLDAICDQVVTAAGVGHMLAMDPVGGLAEVNRSNYSKFVDGQPQFNENGKIIKSVSYTPPYLDPFV